MGKWKEKKLSEISEVIGGGTPKTSVSDYWGNDLVWLSPVDLPEIGKIVEIDDSRKKITHKGLEKSSAKLLPKGTVLYSSRATIGKIGIAKIDLSTNQGFTNFICKDEINNMFLAYALKRYTKEITELSNSTTFKEVSKTAFKNFKIPLPPLPEQQRIVVKLDTLFEKIDKAIALLEENIQHTQALMGSVLDEEFGKLEASSKIVSISKIADVKGGKRLPKGKKLLEKKTKYPYIRVSNFTDYGTISLDGLKFISKDIKEQIARYTITSDDLYISIAGTIGKTGIIPEELNGANLTENAAKLVYKDKATIDNTFVYFYTLSDKFKTYVEDSTKQVAQPKLALTRLKEIKIALPLLEIQKRSVEKFKNAQIQINKLEKNQTQKLENLKALKSSLLDKAFKGEL